MTDGVKAILVIGSGIGPLELQHHLRVYQLLSMGDNPHLIVMGVPPPEKVFDGSCIVIGVPPPEEVFVLEPLKLFDLDQLISETVLKRIFSVTAILASSFFDWVFVSKTCHLFELSFVAKDNKLWFPSFSKGRPPPKHFVIYCEVFFYHLRSFNSLIPQGRTLRFLLSTFHFFLYPRHLS